MHAFSAFGSGRAMRRVLFEPGAGVIARIGRAVRTYRAATGVAVVPLIRTCWSAFDRRYSHAIRGGTRRGK